MAYEEKYHGWAGEVLRVDLSKEKILKEPLDVTLAKSFIGGRGLNTKRLFDGIYSNFSQIDPLGPQNLLLFGVGPLGGTPLPGTARWNVTGKSPLTGLLGDSNCGGFWGPELKFAGYDQIILHGISKDPVYLWIDDDHVELKKAFHLWGKDTFETRDMITEELGDERIHVVAIGPAGENLVRYACIITDESRAAGRTGMGAVMGSKKLKAIAVRGSRDVKIAKPKAFKKVLEEATEKIRTHPVYKSFSKYGTAGAISAANAHGWFPRRNFSEAYVDYIDSVDEDALRQYETRARACFSCPMHCGRRYSIKEGIYAGRHDDVEFGTSCVYNPLIDVDNPEFLLWANTYSNKMGLDTYGCGVSIAWAMECFEKGILTKKDTDGESLTWGNEEAAKRLMKKIVSREGLGDLLAVGVKRAAEIIGKGSEKFASHIKGMELIQELRPTKGRLLGLVVAATGGEHLRSSPMLEWGQVPSKDAKETFGDANATNPSTHKGKAALVIWTEYMFALNSSLPICKFLACSNWWGAFNVNDYSTFLSVTTGWEVTGKDLFGISEKILNMDRAFMGKAGLGRKDDTLHERMLKEAIPSGPTKGAKVGPELQEMLDDYYRLHGWDPKTGLPQEEKLKELGLI